MCVTAFFCASSSCLEVVSSLLYMYQIQKQIPVFLVSLNCAVKNVHCCKVICSVVCSNNFYTGCDISTAKCTMPHTCNYAQ